MKYSALFLIIIWNILDMCVMAQNIPATVQSLLQQKPVRFEITQGGLYHNDYYVVMRVHANKGIKTYWINPGFGGIAPELDLSASTNLKSYHVEWGMPQKVTHADLTNYIIPDGTELAVRLTPDDPTLPMILEGTLHYGYCDTQCKADTQTITYHFDVIEKGDDNKLKEILEKKPVIVTKEYAQKHKLALSEFFTQNVAKDYLMSFTFQGIDVTDDNFFYSLDVEHELTQPIIQKTNPETYHITIDTHNLAKAPKTLQILIARRDAPPLKIVKTLKFTKSPI